jgi:hypothetical protein
MPQGEGRETRPSGHLQVKGSRGQRAWFALWRDADGRHKRRLGRAHVRDSGRRTPRGAIVWRAADGPKPDPTCLSPADADDSLRQLLAGVPRQPTDPRRKRGQDRTFAEECDAWLDYVEHEKVRRPSTVRDYRNAERCYLLPEFGANILLRTIVGLSQPRAIAVVRTATAAAPTRQWRDDAGGCSLCLTAGARLPCKVQHGRRPPP